MARELTIQELRQTLPWSKKKWASRVKPGDVVHAPSCVIVVDQRVPRGDAPVGTRPKVAFRAVRVDERRRLDDVVLWNPHDELLVYGAEEEAARQAWIHGGGAVRTYRQVPSKAEEEGRLF